MPLRSVFACALGFALAAFAPTGADAADAGKSREAAAQAILDKAGIKVGEVIDKNSADKLKDIVSEGIVWLARNGTTLEIVPYRPIPVPKDFLDATEKYSPQVELTPDRMLKNWVAALPFPHIDVNDPQAGTKVMYNFQRTH